MLLRPIRLHGHVLLAGDPAGGRRSLSGFFSVLRQGEHDHRKRFDHWLANVAQAVSNIRALLAGDIIIGGEAARVSRFGRYGQLKSLIDEKSAFHDTRFTLRKSLCVEDQNIIGAALRFVQSYVTDSATRKRDGTRAICVCIRAKNAYANTYTKTRGVPIPLLWMGTPLVFISRTIRRSGRTRWSRRSDRTR